MIVMAKIAYGAHNIILRQAEIAKFQAIFRKHIQIAGVPGRNEPDVGEIHYPFFCIS
jgi:hydroxypyruvate isomerase